MMSLIARNQYIIDTENDTVVLAEDYLKYQTIYLNSVVSFLKSMKVKEPSSSKSNASDDKIKSPDLRKDSDHKYNERINTLLDNKKSVNELENILRSEGRKALIKAVEDLIGVESSDTANKISELLLYSRNIPVESILELIGDKRETELLNMYMKRFEPLIFNKNLEKSIRELFTSFRLAGVESQVVERVLENFGHFYYDISQNFTVDDGIIKFANKKETYEFVYLLIMLHTCHHNPNLENKTHFKWFVDSVKDLCKLSYPSMLEKDLLEIFHGIEAAEFESPISRDLKDKHFSFETLPIELYVRTRVYPEYVAELSEKEFIDACLFKSDKKLFHYNNNFFVPETLIEQGKVYLAN